MSSNLPKGLALAKLAQKPVKLAAVGCFGKIAGPRKPQDRQDRVRTGDRTPPFWAAKVWLENRSLGPRDR
jgi:hypothetical protein